jgi:hypothetical protein
MSSEHTFLASEPTSSTSEPVHSTSNPSSDDEATIIPDPIELKEAHKRKFYEALEKDRSKAINSVIKTKGEYLQMIDKIKQAYSDKNDELELHQKQKLMHIKCTWGLLTVDEREYYVSKKEPLLKYLCLEEIFETIHTSHISIGSHRLSSIS